MSIHGRKGSIRKRVFLGTALFVVCLYLSYQTFSCVGGPKVYMVPSDPIRYIYDEKNRAIPYNKEMPLIFIGGMPRSGTTLMRAMLDAHPLVRCGEETRVIPRILAMRFQWEKSAVEKKRLMEAGMTSEVIDTAISAFILEVIAKHGEAAPRLCNKDPFTLKSSIYLKQLFPNARFLLLIRDGRAVVHSIITRKVTITGFDLTSYSKCLKKWNQAMESMYSQCIQVGPSRCMPVYYEKLVLQPEYWMRKILEFLDLEWDNRVLHHEEYIGKPGGISISKTERSTDQVIQPVNLEALSKWVGRMPKDVVQDMPKIAPMLSVLGYDPQANPPNYGKPDAIVAQNTHDIQNNREYWRKKVDVIIKDIPAKRSTFNRTQNFHRTNDRSVPYRNTSSHMT